MKKWIPLGWPLLVAALGAFAMARGMQTGLLEEYPKVNWTVREFYYAGAGLVLYWVIEMACIWLSRTMKHKCNLDICMGVSYACIWIGVSRACEIVSRYAQDWCEGGQWFWGLMFLDLLCTTMVERLLFAAVWNEQAIKQWEKKNGEMRK